MFKSKSNLIILVLVATLMSCTEPADTSEMAEEIFDLGDTTYFNKFAACRTGSEYSSELMNEMIFAWQGLLDSDALATIFLLRTPIVIQIEHGGNFNGILM